MHRTPPIPASVRAEIDHAFARSADVSLDFRSTVNGLVIEYDGREISALEFVTLAGEPYEAPQVAYAL